MVKDYKVQITMSPEQAKIIMRACELLTRLRIGQIDRVVEEIEDMRFMDLPGDGPIREEEFNKFLNDRDAAKGHANAIKGLMFPEIGPWPGASHGVGHDEKGDTAWEIYTTIRHKISWHEHPEGGFGVNFDKPHNYTNRPLPECTILETK